MAAASLCAVPTPRLTSVRRSPCILGKCNPVPQIRSRERMVSAFCEKAEALESLRSTSAGLGKHLDGVSDKPDEPSKPKERKKNAGFSATASQDLEDIEEIDHSNYYDKIKNAGTPVVLIDFYTTWCGPCKLIYPTLLEMKDDLAGQLPFFCPCHGQLLCNLVSTHRLNLASLGDLVSLGDMLRKVTFYKFNCNKANKQIGQDLNIKVAPTFLIYKGEVEHSRLTGAKIPPLQHALDEALV